MQDNALYYGDCLDWMREWPDGSADLIYLDPPFNSNANYNIIFGAGNGAPAQVRGFEDTWRWDERAARRVAEIESAVSHPLHKATGAFRALLGESGMLAYLTYMGERLVEMRRLLKPTGSIYLHCDPTASHYLKALMDTVFGARHFRNEIAWCYTGPGNVRRWFPRKHDVLLFYACSDEAVFNRDAVRIPYKQLNVQHPDEETGGGIGGRLTPDNVQAGLDSMKPQLALYVGGMGAREMNFHNRQVRRFGYGEAAERIQELYLAGRKREAEEAVPDELCDEIALVGPPERIRERYRHWEDSRITMLNLSQDASVEALRLMAELTGSARRAGADARA